MATPIPNIAEQSVLQKMRTGQPLTSIEQLTLNGWYQKASTAYASTPNSSSGNYSGNTDLQTSYQNFLSEEKLRQAQGLPPRPRPPQFASLAATAAPSNSLNTALDNTAAARSGGTPIRSDNTVVQPLNPPPNSKSTIFHTQPVLQPGATVGTPIPTPITFPTNPPTGPVTPPPTTPPTNPVAPPPPTTPTGTINLPSAPQTVTSPAGGMDNGSTDEQQLIAEAELDKNLRSQTLQNQIGLRSSSLTDLAGVLAKQQAAALSDQMPGIYEDLNTRGLLRSSELGNSVAREASKLTRDTGLTLAQQALTDRNTAADALSGIEDSYIGGRGSAIQRQYSLQDFQRQLDAAKQLGSTMVPTTPQVPTKGSSTLQGALGGGSIGAGFGPVGATIGAAAGGLLGGSSGKK